MAPRFEVTHATPDGNDPDRRIDMIGGPDHGGWKMYVEDAIRQMRADDFTLFVSTPSNVLGNALATVRMTQSNALLGLGGHLGNSEVEVLVRPGGMLSGDHLQTYADGDWSNNLQSLPPCPPAYRLVKGMP